MGILTSNSSLGEQLQLVKELEIFRVQGTDIQGRKILFVVGKFFPARVVKVDALKVYLMENIVPQLREDPFCVVYVHTQVERSQNFPGILALRSTYNVIPLAVKENLQALYFVHPGLQSRVFFATVGRFLFSTGGLYEKVIYVNRLGYLWKHVREGAIEMPSFVYEHDEVLEDSPLLDYGVERMRCGMMHHDETHMGFSSPTKRFSESP